MGLTNARGQLLSELVFVASAVLSLKHTLIQNGRTSLHAHRTPRVMATMVTVVLSLWHMVGLNKQGSRGSVTLLHHRQAQPRTGSQLSSETPPGNGKL